MKRVDFLPLSPDRIELIEDADLRFWTQEFRCSAEHLLDAIEAVGIDVSTVGDYLGASPNLSCRTPSQRASRK